MNWEDTVYMMNCIYVHALGRQRLPQFSADSLHRLQTIDAMHMWTCVTQMRRKHLISMMNALLCSNVWAHSYSKTCGQWTYLSKCICQSVWQTWHMCAQEFYLKLNAYIYFNGYAEQTDEWMCYRTNQYVKRILNVTNKSD